MRCSPCRVGVVALMLCVLGCGEKESIEKVISAPGVFEISHPKDSDPLFVGDSVDCVITVKGHSDEVSANDAVLIELLKEKTSFGSWAGTDEPGQEPGSRKVVATIKMPNRPGSYHLKAMLFHISKTQADQTFECKPIVLTVKQKLGS